MDKNTFDALVRLFKAIVCGNREKAYDYIDNVPLKWLREELEKEGFTFDPFDEDNEVRTIRISSVVNEYLKKHDNPSRPSVKKYLSEWWFPFNEKELELVLDEIKKKAKTLKEEKDKIKLVGDNKFVKIKNRDNGIEKIFYALKVLAKHKLIELVHNSWAKTIDERVNIKEIFGNHVPAINTALGWYKKEDCETVFPKLYNAMINCGLEAEKEIKIMAKLDGKTL